MHEGTVGASVSGRTAGREGGDRAAAGFGRRRAVLAVIRVELMQLRIIAPYLLIMPAGMIIPDLVMGESKNTGVSILFALWWRSSWGRRSRWPLVYPEAVSTSPYRCGALMSSMPTGS